MNWYRWNDKATAEQCLFFINHSPVFPIGKKVSDATTTKQWHGEVVECLDGKYGFPAINDAFFESLKFNKFLKQRFFDYFNPSIEPKDESWFPNEE